MILLRIICLLFCFNFLIAPFTFSQSIDSLIQLNAKARGGLTVLKSVESIVMSGTATIESQKAEYSVYIKRPHYIRIDLSYNSVILIQVYNGEDAFTFNSESESKNLEPMGLQEKIRLINESDMDGALLDYKQKGNQVNYEGMELVEGKKCHVLLVELANGSRKRTYIDEKSHQIIKESSFRTVKGRSPLATSLVKVESVFEGFTHYGELVLPKLITTLMDSNVISVLRINSVKTNTLDSNTVFEKETVQSLIK